MAIYITGDIHGDPSRFNELKWFCKNHKDAEWIICLGDVGLNYYGKDHPRELYLKNLASEVPAKLFCIHGNHEYRPHWGSGYNVVEIDNDFIKGYAWVDPKYPNQYFALDGAVYKIKTSERTLTAVVCGGAYSVDKYYRLSHGWNWWNDEQPSNYTKMIVKEIVKEKCPDIMLTHTCPTRFVPKELFLAGIDQSKVDNSTEEFLDEVYELFPVDKKPMWYFGHFHGNKYTEDYVMLIDDIIELK